MDNTYKSKEMRHAVQRLLKSNLTGYYIAKHTGISQTTITYLRKEKRTLDNMTLKNMELLYQLYLDNEADIEKG